MWCGFFFFCMSWAGLSRVIVAPAQAFGGRRAPEGVAAFLGENPPGDVVVVGQLVLAWRRLGRGGAAVVLDFFYHQRLCSIYIFLVHFVCRMRPKLYLKSFDGVYRLPADEHTRRAFELDDTNSANRCKVLAEQLFFSSSFFSVIGGILVKDAVVFTNPPRRPRPSLRRSVLGSVVMCWDGHGSVLSQIWRVVYHSGAIEDNLVTISD